MARRLSFEEFDERVQKAYNGKISIIRETYIDTRHRVTAYCNVHKIRFERSARDLANGYAKCPECFKEKNTLPKNSWENMLERFIEKYGNKFSYDPTTYNGYKKEMTVYCNDCGETFSITPEHHLKYNNGGCPNCQNNKILKCSICGKDVIVDKHCSDNYKPICSDCKEDIKNSKIKKHNKKRRRIKDWSIVYN